jgi:hypothetical protein
LRKVAGERILALDAGFRMRDDEPGMKSCREAIAQKSALTPNFKNNVL